MTQGTGSVDCISTHGKALWLEQICDKGMDAAVAVEEEK